MTPIEEMEIKAYRSGVPSFASTSFYLLHCHYCNAKIERATQYRINIKYGLPESFGGKQLLNGQYCKPECLRKAIDLVVIE